MHPYHLYKYHLKSSCRQVTLSSVLHTTWLCPFGQPREKYSMSAADALLLCQPGESNHVCSSHSSSHLLPAPLFSPCLSLGSSNSETTHYAFLGLAYPSVSWVSAVRSQAQIMPGSKLGMQMTEINQWGPWTARVSRRGCCISAPVTVAGASAGPVCQLL